MHDLIRADMEREVYRIYDFKKMLEAGIELGAKRIYPADNTK